MQLLAFSGLKIFKNFHDWLVGGKSAKMANFRFRKFQIFRFFLKKRKILGQNDQNGYTFEGF